MPLFRYEIVDKNGRPMLGAMDAASEADARQKLISKGFTVNSVTPTASQPSAPPRPRLQTAPPDIRASGVHAPPKEMSVFFRGMASYLKSGMNIYDALTHINRTTPNRAMRIMSERMAARVQSGQKLSQAMLEFPKAFAPHVIGVTAAGEMGGFLPVVIGDVALDYELAERSSNRWIKYLSKLLWINALLSFPFVPIPMLMFSPGVEDLRSGVMKGVHASMIYVVIPMTLMMIAYYVTVMILRQPSMRYTTHGLLLRTPFGVGKASKERSLASFSRILWRLQSAGILPINAWDAASRAAENVVVAERLHEQVDGIRSGKKFSEALALTGLFNSEDQRILSIGESTGQMADVLQRMAGYYEDAALSSAGRIKWLGFRISLFVTLLSLGAVTISCALIYPQMMRWVDWFMKAE